MPGTTTIIDWLGTGAEADLPDPVALDALLVAGATASFYAHDTGTDRKLNRDTVAWDVVASSGVTGITTLTGDVTAGPGSGAQAATIANNAVTTAKIINSAVTNAKLADMAAGTIKANLSGSPAAPDDATLADVAAALAPLMPGAAVFVPVSKTADYSISAGDVGTTFNTVGASADVAGSLPAADTVGLWFRFAVSTADYHKVEADGTDTFVWGGATSDPGGYMRSNVLGSVLRVECHEAGVWIVMSESGHWDMDQ